MIRHHSATLAELVDFDLHQRRRRCDCRLAPCMCMSGNSKYFDNNEMTLAA